MHKLNDHFRVEIILVLLAIGIGVLENIVPKPFPFLKLGLANVVTVSAIIRYGTMTGLRINVLRSTGAALILGIIATPTYLLSLAGG
ncbi:MAG: Gx transporter family protein, partial [Candidatus Fermentibacteraceae bacterium]|nr:Gx transporter family protein [Candidatus Fermentibacteraceae bacterium]